MPSPKPPQTFYLPSSLSPEATVLSGRLSQSIGDPLFTSAFVKFYWQERLVGFCATVQKYSFYYGKIHPLLTTPYKDSITSFNSHVLFSHPSPALFPEIKQYVETGMYFTQICYTPLLQPSNITYTSKRPLKHKLKLVRLSKHEGKGLRSRSRITNKRIIIS